MNILKDIKKAAKEINPKVKVIDLTKKATTPKSPPAKKRPIRQRRIQGITELLTRYHNTKEENYLKLAYQRAITHYLTNNLTFNGYKISLPELSRYLGLPLSTLIQEMGQQTKEMLSTDKNGNILMLGALLSAQIGKALGTQHLAEKQASMLYNQQNGRYVPFLSSSANQAITNLLSAHKPILEVMKLMVPSGPSTAIQINHHGNAQVPTEKAIGPNEAVLIISQQKDHITLLDNPADQALLAESYIIGNNLPEVIATKQQGTNEQVGNVYVPSKIKKHESRNDASAYIPLAE